MMERVSKLLSVKSIVTIALTGVFCYLAITGAISEQTVNTVYATVIAFYFGTQAEKRSSGV